MQNQGFGNIELQSILEYRLLKHLLWVLIIGTSSFFGFVDPRVLFGLCLTSFIVDRTRELKVQKVTKKTYVRSLVIFGVVSLMVLWNPVIWTFVTGAIVLGTTMQCVMYLCVNITWSTLMMNIQNFSINKM